MADEWLTVEEASVLSGYSIQYIRRLLRSQKVEARKFGRAIWQVNKQGLLDFIREAETSEDKRKGPRT